MFGQQLVQARQFRHEVFIRAPIHAAGVVDVHFFIGKPFHAVCKSVAAIDAGERGELISHQRPCAPSLSQAWIVMGFAIMDQRADARTLQQRVVEIASNIVSTVFLKQFRIGPLHTTACEKRFSIFPPATEPFEEENRIRKFLTHSSNDVTPDRHGHFVAGITTESIDTAPTPR